VDTNQTTARQQEKVERKLKDDMNTWNFTSVEHFMVSTQREGLYGKMEHDVLLVEISERSGRKQSARVLLSTLRSMGMKYVTEVGVAQAESVTRAIVPSKIQLVRVDLNIPGDRDCKVLLRHDVLH